MDIEGIPLSNKYVIFNINNVPYTKITDSDGIAKIKINLNPGIYTVKYEFNGDAQYAQSKSEINISVFIGNTYLLPLEKDIYRTETFKVGLFDEDENPLSEKIITFLVNDRSYQRTTNIYGVAELKINLNPGQYLITYSFQSTGNYQSCSGFCQMNVYMKNITFCPIDINIISHNAFRVKVTDTLGNPVRNQTIKLTFDNVPYLKITDSEGITRLNINFDPGSYPMIIEFASPLYSMYYSCQKSYSINVFENNNNPVLTSLGNCIQRTTPYKIKLTDSNNNPLSNKMVHLTINSVCYTRISDSNGIVKLNINLGYNNYVISVSYGALNSVVSTYEMITVTDNQMNNNSNVSYAERISYIIINNPYQCLNDIFIINLANNITEGITNDLEKAVLIHNYCL